MTANQLQNAANIESARHNAAVEEETAYHNREIENVEQERNRINQDWNTFQEEFSQRQQDWKEQYDAMYLEFQQANEERKRELESEMNEINRLSAEADATFKQKQTEYNEAMLALKAQADYEISRHNKELEGIQFLEWQTQDKWVEYQNWANIEHVGIEKEKLKQNWTKIENDQVINFEKLAREDVRLGLEREQFEWNKSYQEHLLMNQDLDLFLQEGRNKMQHELNKSEEFRNYASGVSQAAQALFQGVSLFTPKIGSKSNLKTLSQGVKYGKEIAEALLFK